MSADFFSRSRYSRKPLLFTPYFDLNFSIKKASSDVGDDNFGELFPRSLYIDRPSLSEALRMHQKSMPALSNSSRIDTEKSIRNITKVCSSWSTFVPSTVWNSYRSLPKFQDHAPTSAANHLRVHLRKFVPWCVRREWLGIWAIENLYGIPSIAVFPRRISPCGGHLLEELLRRCKADNLLCGLFLHFLATTGCRITSALNLNWSQINFQRSEILLRMKGGNQKFIPIGSPVISCLNEVANMKITGQNVFPLSAREIRAARKSLSTHSKSLGLDLLYPHSLRHNYASLALAQGLNAKEIAELLGHEDGGFMILKVYGHVLNNPLRQKLRKFNPLEEQPSPETSTCLPEQDMACLI